MLLQGAGTTASNKTLDLFLICLWEKIDNNGLLKSDGDKSCGKRKGLPEVEICQKGRLIKMTSFEGRIKGGEGGFKMYDNYKKNVF